MEPDRHDRLQQVRSEVVNRFISSEDSKDMTTDSKIGLVATVDEQGAPHISFLSSLQPLGTEQLTVGQFCEGLSKKHMAQRREIGFLIFLSTMETWRGRAVYENSASSGPEYEIYNQKPMFRYNAYFGIGLVHYFKLLDISAREKLSKGQIIAGALKTRLILPLASSSEQRVLNEISRAMFSEIDGLKFIAYLDEEGFPCLVPVIQAANAGLDRVVFALNPYREELLKIPDGSAVAVFFVNLKMESVLVKGIYNRKKYAGLPYGCVDLERVYNSMPPQPRYIYPPLKSYETVEEF